MERFDLLRECFRLFDLDSECSDLFIDFSLLKELAQDWLGVNDLLSLADSLINDGEFDLEMSNEEWVWVLSAESFFGGLGSTTDADAEKNT